MMTANVHGVTRTGARVKTFEHFAAIELVGGGGEVVTLFVGHDVESDLTEIARIGDALARQARRELHERLTALRTEGVERAVKVAS